jgi:hypothetical protein
MTISRRNVFSLFGLATVFGIAAATTPLSLLDAEAQTTEATKPTTGAPTTEGPTTGEERIAPGEFRRGTGTAHERRRARRAARRARRRARRAARHERIAPGEFRRGTGTAQPAPKQ